MTLDEIEKLLTRDARTVFPDRLDDRLKDLRRYCHPDRFTDEAEKRRAEAAFIALGKLADAAAAPPVTIKSPKRSYTLGRLIGVGDVADVHEAEGGGTQYVVKSSRIPDGARLLETEWQSLATLHTAAADTTYRKYLPLPCESFAVRDKIGKRVNVFAHEDGFHGLAEVRQKHSEVGGRHIGWIFNRLLTVLGFVHRQGIVHGAILSPHVQVHAASHGLRLLGWGQSVAAGSPITRGSADYLPWYPPEVKAKRGASAATDVYMAAGCMQWLAGSGLPLQLDRFLRSCRIEAPGMRPDDAWQLQGEWEATLKEVYGPKKFVELPM